MHRKIYTEVLFRMDFVSEILEARDQFIGVAKHPGPVLKTYEKPKVTSVNKTRKQRRSQMFEHQERQPAEGKFSVRSNASF